MICLYIEDKKEIREDVLDFYFKTVPYNYNDVELEVVNFPFDNRKLSKGYVGEQIIEFILSRPEEETFVIFTDYGIKTGPNNEDYVYITDIFREIVKIEPDFFESINKIVIYSYQLGVHLKFYTDIDLFKNQYSKYVDIIDFETSLVFNKRVGSKLYNKDSNDIWQLKESLVQHYSVLIAKTLLEFLGFTEAKGLSLLAKSSRDMNRYIYFMNTCYFNKEFKTKSYIGDISDYRLSFISFINPEEIEAKYSIDAPYKPYYLEINNYIEKHSLSNIFKNSKGDYFKGLNFIYFRVYKENLEDKTILNVFYFSQNSFEKNLLPKYFLNTEEVSAEESFKFWIKATFFQLYHHDVSLDERDLGIIDYFNDSVDVNLVNQDEAKNNPLDYTEYIWFFQELEIESFQYKGLLNYGYHRENGGILQSLDLKHIEKDIQNLFIKRRPLIVSKILDTLYPSFKENIRKQSLLNALSTVLNRNGSHNLGSHVLATLSSDNLITRFLNNEKGKTIYTPIYYLPINSKSNSHKVNEQDKIESQKNESLIAYFNAYLKNRLDLLAAVGTSGEAVMLNNKPLFAGVFKNFERNLILLEHISGKGADFRYKFNLTTDDPDITDIEVAMPNDLLGDQAFYLLLENVIRNTAKHGIYKSSEQVEFTINVNTKESDDNFYAIEIWDNNCLQERVDLENKNIEKEGNKKSKVTIVAETNERIDKDILKEDFNIREGGWGTIEMKIACCYLSGLPLKNIDNNSYRTDAINNRLPIIQAFEKVISPNKSHLGYRFYIQKPKRVLVIDLKKNFQNETNTVAKLKEKGIDILSLSCKEFKARLKNKEIYKHQFIVALAEKETDEIKSDLNEWYLNKQLPNRCLFISDKQLINENLENICNRFYYYEPIKIDIDNPTKNDQFILKGDSDYCFFSYDNYETYYEDKGINPKEAVFKNHGWNEVDYDYFEPYGSASSLGLLLANFKPEEQVSENSEFATFGKLVDAVQSKVLVIDERIQEARNSYYKPEKEAPIELYKVFSKSKITVPNNDPINLNKAQDIPVKIKKYIVGELNSESYSYLIFHFGILEKIANYSEDYKDSKKRFKSFLNYIRKSSKNPNLKIILTSGRGIPSDLPDDEYFCNFSSINYYLVDSYGRSKPHLLTLLRNLRSK